MAADFFLGKERLAVDDKMKNALAARNECEAFNDVMVIAHDFVRHTGGTRPIISGNAVFKRYHVFGHGLLHRDITLKAMIGNALVIVK